MSNEAVIAELSSLFLTPAQLILVTHANPDPDAYGSMLGLGLSLEALGHSVTFLNESQKNKGLAWFPQLERVYHGEEALQVIETLTPQYIIVCDCAEWKRVGEVLGPKLLSVQEKGVAVVNIDHHITNPGFGTINYVEPEASSTSELVFLLLQEIEKSVLTAVSPIASPLISPIASQCLYLGLSADTGSFRFSCTGPRTFEVASHLLARGADPLQASLDLYSNVSYQSLLLRSEALRNLQLYHEGKVAEVVVRKELFTRYGTEEGTDDLAALTVTVQGVEMGYSLREMDDIIRVSLRARTPQFDVSAVAQQFGGGGHRSAAAFRWRKSIEELRPLLLSALHETLRSS